MPRKKLTDAKATAAIAAPKRNVPREDVAVRVARVAANVFFGLAADRPEDAKGEDWVTAGDARDADHHAVSTIELAAFARLYPTAPPEAFWRRAHALDLHGGDPHGWERLPACVRGAYALFVSTLMITDSIESERLACVAAAARAAAAPKNPADDLDEEDRIDGRLPDPLALVPGRALGPVIGMARTAPLPSTQGGEGGARSATDGVAATGGET